MSNVKGVKLKKKIKTCTFQVLSCLPAPAAGVHSDASRLPAQLSQCGQDSNGVANTAHSQGSLKENPPASTFHCRASNVAAPARMRDN